MSVRRLGRGFAVAACAATIIAAGGTSASAGEITGNGKPIVVKGASECAYSGQNDEFHQGEEGASRVQSYGQIIRFAGPMGGIPGTACNPSRTR